MNTQTIERVQFQVMSDDMFLLSEVAAQNGWTDVETFWQGEMIKGPIDMNGWRLFPADQYEYSIPSEAVERVMLLLNSGVKIQGVVIADDLRALQGRQIPPDRESQPVNPDPIQIDWDAVETALKVLGTIAAVIAAIVTMSALLYALATLGVGLLVATVIVGALVFDPKLIVLISDGNGGTEWVCLYTWYDPPSR